MAKATPIITAFNAGEWSPLMGGRVDLQGYAASASVLENFIPTVQGPIVRRGGTRFVAGTEDSAVRSWLVPFVRSRTVSYVIEFGDSVLRFYFGRAQVLSGMSPYELVSPYNAAALTLPSGEFALDIVQSADVLFIVDRRGVLAPRKLTRTSATSWAFSTLAPDTGPFSDINATATTVYASAATGTVTLTASASAFTADDIGSLIRIEQSNVSTEPWEPLTVYTAGAVVRSEGKEYVAVADGTSGATIPSHTRGSVSDGGVSWTYRAAGYGVARITAIVTPTEATATVLFRFPVTVVGSGNATPLWRRGAWSIRNGYPTTVSFFNERLCFGQGSRVHMSVVADFESFAPDEFGEILADSAVTLSVNSSQVDEIVALIEGEALNVHTQGGEFSVGALTTSEPFGPGNVKVMPASGYGAQPIRPVRVGEAVLFVQAAGRKLREMVFDIQVNNQIARDMTVRAEHITKPALVALSRQEEPYQLIWGLRSDGVPLVFVYDRTQEVRGWARMPMTGVVESIAVIPSPDGSRDDLWMIVRRTIDEATVRYVEWMTPGYDGSIEDALFMDSGLTYDSTPATTISGLDHLEGDTVRVLVDGAAHPDRVVTGGDITLQRAGSVVQVGLPFASVWGSSRIEAGAADGAAQTKTKRITDVAFRVVDTLGGSAGSARDNTDDIPMLTFRSAATPMDSGSPLFTGDALIDWPGGYEKDGRIFYVNDTAFPATLVAVVPQVVTQEAR